MRAVAARVTEASVRVGGEIVGAIEGPGLLVAPLPLTCHE